MTFKLTDLPVEPNYDEVTCSYISQVKNIDTVEGIQAHVSKWKAIWNMDVSGEYLKSVTKEEHDLVNGTYDASTVLHCLKKLNEPNGQCGHTTPSCHGMHIILPPVLLISLMLAQHYGVPPDVALIQVCGGYEAIEK